MKTLALIFMFLAGLKAAALDFNYSTNLYAALSYPTNLYLGTNSLDGTTNGDTFITWGNKLNWNTAFFWTGIQNNSANITSNANAIAALATNPPVNFVPATNYPVTSSSSSTLNLPVGYFSVTTNYIYIVVGTNQWARIAVPTDTW